MANKSRENWEADAEDAAGYFGETVTRTDSLAKCPKG